MTAAPLPTPRPIDPEAAQGQNRPSTPLREMAGEKAYLEQAIDRFSPKVAATARAALKKLRTRFPGSRQLVYERRGSLPIGFAPSGGGEAPFSLVLYPRYVRFFFLEGVAIDDPEGRLEGAGNRVRSIRLDDDAAILDDPYVRWLMGQALTVAAADLVKGAGQVVLKSTITRLPARKRNVGRR
jgi:hypothetical protein